MGNTRPGYDPEWVEFENAVRMPPLPDGPDARREAFNAGLIAFAQQLPPTDPGISTRDDQISPEVKVRIYTPPSLEGRKLPLIVFAHGGGWLAGNLDTEDHMCRTICGEVPSIVVSVDYRIFPWVKFPMPIDDCYNAFQWAYNNADQLQADKTRLCIWGGSAGAALAIAATYRLVSSGQGDRIHGLIPMAGMFLSPEVVPEKYKNLHNSYVENGGPVAVVTVAYDLVVGRPGITDVNWFPLAGGADTLKGFPRTYIINTDKEAQRDDGSVLEAALKDASVPVMRDILPGLPHYAFVFPLQKAGEKFRRTLIEGVKWVVN